MENKSVDFFDAQFRRQIAAGEYALNPFEQAAEKFVSSASGALLQWKTCI
jgi:hypothetical protein